MNKLALLLAPAALLASVHAADVDVHVGKTVEITQSHSWCWFPTVHKFRSGEIMVGMVLSPDQINSESATSAYCISRDGGLTWSRRYTMGEGANQDGAWSAEPDSHDMFWQVGSYPEPQKDGDQRHYFMTLTKYGRGGMQSSEIRDATLTLTEPGDIRAAWLFDYRFNGKVLTPDTHYTTQFHGRPWGNIVRGPDGAFYCTAYFDTVADGDREEAIHAQSDDPRHAPRFLRSVVLRSADEGKDWVEQGVIAKVPATGDRPAWVGFEGYGEASLAFLPDGRLYSVYRTGGNGGTIGNGWSSDNGKTWTPPAPIGFTGVAPRVHRLSNGMLVLVTGRPGPVVLRLNPDGRGEKWTSGTTIYSEMSSRYTDVVEVSPGHLLVVYDHLPYGWYEIPFPDRDARNIIYGTFVDLAQK